MRIIGYSVKIIIFIAILLMPTGVYAKAKFAYKNEMIEKADVIAVVNITKIEPVQIKGKGWTYRQKATAKVEQSLKGKVPAEISLYGQEDFICAQCNYESGKSLVFLKRDNDLLKGSNWQFSIRPIKDDKVEWYQSDKGLELKAFPLSEVLEEIKSKVKH